MGVLIRLVIVILLVAEALAGPLSGTLGTPSNPFLGSKKLSESENTVYLLDDLNKISHQEENLHLPQAFMISPVSSRPPTGPSELSQVLPQLFHFMESMMVIMYNVARPDPVHQVHYHHHYHQSKPSFTYPEDSSRFHSPSFIPSNVPNNIPPIDPYYNNYYWQQQQFEASRRTWYPSAVDDQENIAGRSEDNDETSSVHLVKHLSKYCVFQGVSTFYPYDCFKYLICIPTKYNRFEALIAHCPRDKRFSSTYRRCVQPYLVPECFRNSPANIMTDEMAQVAPLQKSKSHENEEEGNSDAESYYVTPTTRVPIITSQPLEITSTTDDNNYVQTLVLLSTNQNDQNLVDDQSHRILPSHLPIAEYSDTTTSASKSSELNLKLDQSYTTTQSPMSESHYEPFQTSTTVSPEAHFVE